MTRIPDDWPVIGVCGYSGSGKTTLIERLLPLLMSEGLTVAVIKHDAHRLAIDRPGKDSDRLFRAGAVVLAYDPHEGFIRFAHRGAPILSAAVERLRHDCDLVLVEGHKHTDLPVKIWLRSPADPLPPPEGLRFEADLAPGDDRVRAAFDVVMRCLQNRLQRAALRAGILIGGRSSRMGRPKHLIPLEGKTWLEHVAASIASLVGSVCLVGNGEVPRSLGHLPQLADAPDRSGPIAGMLAAMRWDPEADWMFVACDMPSFSSAAASWVLAQRRPGRWAVLPRDPVRAAVQPLAAWYDRRIRRRLEQVDSPKALEGHAKVVHPAIPAPLASAFVNFNTPDALPSQRG